VSAAERPPALDPTTAYLSDEALAADLVTMRTLMAWMQLRITALRAEHDYREARAAGRCPVFVSPRILSRDGYATDRCVECREPWDSHRNIGPGWRDRSEARKDQLSVDA
jgi:hypothetical protein